MIRSLLIRSLSFLFAAVGLVAAVADVKALPLRSVEQAAPTADEWIPQSPLPSGNNLTGVSWATATHGLISGESHTLIETFDAGATWRTITLGGFATDPFYNVLCRT